MRMIPVVWSESPTDRIISTITYIGMSVSAVVCRSSLELVRHIPFLCQHKALTAINKLVEFI